MGEHVLPVLLITANVGSVFENRDGLEEHWIRETLGTITRLKPKFVALHFQESGGKDSGEESLKNVKDFTRIFLGQSQVKDKFDKVRAWFDQDYHRQEQYTALGCVYLVSKSLDDVSLWNFEDSTFRKVEGEETCVGCLTDVPFVEKEKFPLDFFPKFKWSRKGFMRTRWKINKCVFDLLNIHLFHDASNLISIEMTPSMYSKNRKRALDHVLDRLLESSTPLVPHMIFGDFNFRLDNKRVVESLCAGLPQQHIRKEGETTPSKIIYRDRKKAEKVFLTLEPRIFKFHDQSIFRNHNGKRFSKYNREFDVFKDRLFEFDISFFPSYPFSENVKETTIYGDSRCPSWCDRIFLSHSSRAIIDQKKGSPAVVYDMIGKTSLHGRSQAYIFIF
ncbi:Type I inositol 1,4,5-trisphosphate 5-phosphatase [Desmophyllum pertusum]|uniref:inositol-polyphosphate 5-phosphatase n=1 Tax=Desmophyllum pertusum TaxID=174260 RepID=A0A9X0D358_9CNID|nr:Type I inositol 1,4,5-trisphosphate 5-phosphatase [Desmophyllum pertusum]